MHLFILFEVLPHCNIMPHNTDTNICTAFYCECWMTSQTQQLCVVMSRVRSNQRISNDLPSGE